MDWQHGAGAEHRFPGPADRPPQASGSIFALLKAEIGTTVRESHEAAHADFSFIAVEYNQTRLRKYPVYGYVTSIENRPWWPKISPTQRKHSLSMVVGELQTAPQRPTALITCGRTGEVKGHCNRRHP